MTRHLEHLFVAGPWKEFAEQNSKSNVGCDQAENPRQRRETSHLFAPPPAFEVFFFRFPPRSFFSRRLFRQRLDRIYAVSYTHLTLPTIYSV